MDHFLCKIIVNNLFFMSLIGYLTLTVLELISAKYNL